MKEILNLYPGEIVKKAKKIKALLFDVDGVLTNGKIIYMGDESEIKEFHVRDGQIIKPLREAGILVGIITGRVSEAVLRRALELEFDIIRQGIKNKLECYEKIKSENDLSSEEIAFIGDDFPDVEIMENCLLGICPADAPDYIRLRADWVTKAKGGEGVVREVADLILSAQGKFPI
jgi:3-deoxy-D-manno-octulosonate 8-phosphate phosphatase (KDO 8-P phosphatase)